MSKNYFEIQENFCKTYDRPIFIPHDGLCYHCFKNIWDKLTAADASSRLITSCPHCHQSFVD